MKDNIFFLSDASYCDNSKTAIIAVFNCFSKERFIKKLFDIKNSTIAEFLALSYAVKIADNMGYKNVVFVYDCRTLDVESLKIYITKNFRFKTFQFLWLCRNYLKEPDKIARQHTILKDSLNVKSVNMNHSFSNIVHINEFLSYGLKKVQNMILQYFKNSFEMTDYEVFQNYINGNYELKAILKKRTTNIQLYRFFYHILPINERNKFYQYIIKAFPRIKNESHFKTKLKNNGLKKHIITITKSLEELNNHEKVIKGD